MSENCIFCQIIEGKIPAAKVYEDEDVFAFLDISQVTKGHTLIIPKQHVRNLYDTSSETAQKLFAPVPKIANAIQKAYGAIGMNLVNNNEAAAGQTVFHLHLHLIPKYKEGEGFGHIWPTHEDQYSAEDLQAIAREISQRL